MPVYTRRKFKALRDTLKSSQRGTCLICLIEIPPTTPKGILPCAHNHFCFSCILDWSRITNQCPLCKFRFSRIKNEQTEEIVLTSHKDQVPDEEFFIFDTKCVVCGSFDEEEIMLLCDQCNKGFHTICLGMNRIPDVFEWYCDECINRLSSSRARVVIKAMIRAGRNIPNSTKRLKK